MWTVAKVTCIYIKKYINSIASNRFDSYYLCLNMSILPFQKCAAGADGWGVPWTRCFVSVQITTLTVWPNRWWTADWSLLFLSHFLSLSFLLFIFLPFCLFPYFLIITFFLFHCCFLSFFHFVFFLNFCFFIISLYFSLSFSYIIAFCLSSILSFALLFVFFLSYFLYSFLSWFISYHYYLNIVHHQKTYCLLDFNLRQRQNT